MTPRELFGVAVRIVGLGILGCSLLYLVDAVVLLIDPDYFAKAKLGTPSAPALHYFRNGVVCLLVGGYLLRGGKIIVRIAYGKGPP